MDSCLIRNYFGEKVNLFGCDVHEESFDIFFEIEDLKCNNILSHKALPYEDESFDTLIRQGMCDVPKVRDRAVVMPEVAGMKRLKMLRITSG